ncbi:MAG: hypothetical protein ACE5I1_16325 [bacterium]
MKIASNYSLFHFLVLAFAKEIITYALEEYTVSQPNDKAGNINQTAVKVNRNCFCIRTCTSKTVESFRCESFFIMGLVNEHQRQTPAAR